MAQPQHDSPPPEHDRVPRRRATIKKLDTAHQPEHETYTVEQAREMIDSSITTYLETPDPAHMLLVRAQAGTGKTTIAVQHAERLADEGQRVLYCGPRHDFYQDVMRVASTPGHWYEWLPRQQGTDEKPETCRYAPQINTWIARGYTARSFCQNPTICGAAYVKNTCPWHRQSTIEEPIIFAQHPHIVSHPLIEQAGVVFGDEMPLSAFLPNDGGKAGRWIALADITMPTRFLGKFSAVQQQAYADVSALIDALRGVCTGPQTNGGAVVSGPSLIASLGGPHVVLRTVGAYRKVQVFFEDDEPFLQSPDESSAAPMRYHSVLFDLLESEASAYLAGDGYIYRIQASRAGLRFLIRRYPHRATQNKHIIWLDATGDPALYREMFQRPVDVVSPYVPLRGRLYQITDSLNGKATLQDGERPSDQASKVREQAQTIIDDHDYRNPAIIAPQSILGQYQRYASHYYYANRGTNRLQACDSVLVIGAPSPGHAAIYDMAAMLFQRRTRPLPPPEEAWTVQDVPFAYDAGDAQPGRSITSATFIDSDLRALLWQYREAELIQSIHRVRPILHNVDVWLLTNIPVDELPPTHLMSVADLFGVPTRTQYLDDGTPYEERAKIDPYIWRQVQLLAEITSDETGYVAPWHIIDGLNVKRDAANRYIRALIDYCGWIEISVTREGTRRPAVGCTRINLPS